MAKPEPTSTFLKGWQQTAEFLGLPISAAQRWAKSGMPVTREGRRGQSSRRTESLARGEASEPGQITTELMRGLSYVGKHKGTRSRKEAA
ncbi:MAG TPA: hypothetical protein VMU26_30670 [Candidatus Polarisedimenticolia bacterium]|nr:hypothetical protein [Candidatus Polarisedimenticolia bacterium]